MAAPVLALTASCSFLLDSERYPADDGAPHEGASPDGGSVLIKPDGGAVERTATACGDTITDALFCESFEDPASGAMWTSTARGSVEMSPAYRGSLGVRARVAPTSDANEDARAQVGRRVLDGLTSGAVYTRAYVYLPGSPGELMFLGFAENGGAFAHVSAGLDGDGTARVDATTATLSGYSENVLPRDRWLCVELAVTIGAQGSARVTVDGAAVVELVGIDTVPGLGFENVLAGVVWAETSEAGSEVQIDELVVDDQPIGCD